MKLRFLKIEVKKGATEAALMTAVNDWLADREEEDVVEIRFAADGTNVWALILYTEE